MDTSRHIALIGLHAPDFISTLEEKGHSTTSYANYAEYKQAGTTAKAIVITGHDTDFADPSELAALLDSFSVLAMFAPSPGVLDALVAATKTTKKAFIDFRVFKITEGTPLILHRVPDLRDVKEEEKDKSLHVVPGITVQTIDPNAVGAAIPAEKMARFVSEFAAKVAARKVKRSAYEIHKALSRVAVGYVLPSKDSLPPPPSTTQYSWSAPFYFPGTILVPLAMAPWTESSPWVSCDDDDEEWSSDRMVDLYFYHTADNKCYFVFLNKGSLQRDSVSGPRVVNPPTNAYWFIDSFQFAIQESPKTNYLTKDSHSPDGYASRDGTTYTYDVNYQQSFDLYGNDGSSVPWTASYNETYQLEGFMQRRSDLSKGYQSRVDYAGLYNRFYGDLDNGKWTAVFDDTDKNFITVKSLPPDILPFRGITVFHMDYPGSGVNFSVDCPLNSVEIIAFKSTSYSTFNSANRLPIPILPDNSGNSIGMGF